MKFDPKKVKLPRGKGFKLHPILGAVALLGGYRPAARVLGVSWQAVHQWAKAALVDRNFLIPAERVPAISRATGIAPYLFRPDLWERGMTFAKRGAR